MITEKSGVRIVAATVANALEDAGIHAVLTGGACASITRSDATNRPISISFSRIALLGAASTTQ